MEKEKKISGEEFIALPQEERDRLNKKALDFRNRRNEKRREEARKESEKVVVGRAMKQGPSFGRGTLPFLIAITRV